MISDNVCETINEEVCETVNDEECTTVEEESCLPSYKQECTDIQELEVGTTVQVYNKTTSGQCPFPLIEYIINAFFCYFFL